MTDAFPILQDEAPKWEDERGYLQVLYESGTMVLKRSFSRKGVFRGLHVQSESYPQIKLIRIVEGSILDFVVSIRDPSKEIICKEIRPEHDWIRIDAHFAHGFYALEDTVFEYICDGAYNEEAEQAWSIIDYLADIPGVGTIMLSEKDQAAPKLEGAVLVLKDAGPEGEQ